MKKGTMILAMLFLSFATLSTAADKEIPQGLRKAALERLPEISNLPSGTLGLEFEAAWMADGLAVRTEVEAESKKSGIEMRLRTRPKKAGKEAVYADVPGGPMAAAKAVLLALHSRDFQKLRDLIDPAEVEKAIEELGSEIDKIEKKAGAAHGITLKRIADEFLADVAVPPGSATLKFGYEAAIEAGGVKGKLEIGFKMFVTDRSRPRWVLSDLELGFEPLGEEGVEAPVERPQVLPDGLRAFVASLAIPDLAEFPAGTGEISVVCVAKVGDSLCEIECGFAKSGDSHMLTTVKVNPAEEEESFCPERAITENPIDSIKKVMKAFRAGDLDTLLPYMPADMKEMAADQEFREMFKKQMLEEMTREEEKKGYAPDTAILAAVPTLLTPLGPCARFGFSFSHPVRIKEKDGRMKVEIEFTAEKGNEANFVIKDMDADFDQDGGDGGAGKDEAEPGEEKGE